MGLLAKRRFDIVGQKQVILLTIPPIFLALATIVVGIRWHARKTKRINTLVEDLLCLCGLIMSVLVVIIVFVLVLVDGQGLSTDIVLNKFGQTLGIRWWLRTQFAVDICWATSVTAVQLSLLQFYTRLYDRRRSFLLACYGMMGLSIAWYIYALAAWAYHCHPPGSCTLASRGNCVAIGLMHVALNALVMGLSIPSVYYMNLSSQRKLSMIGLMLLGCFCTICAILRMDCVFPFFADIKVDPIGAAWGRMLFSPLEIAVGIIACSIPTLTTFRQDWQQRPHLPKESTGLRRLKFRSTSSSSSTSNLNPAHWGGKTAGQVNAFVTLEEAGKSSERVQGLGPHDIKVTKEYNVGQTNDDMGKKTWHRS